MARSLYEQIEDWRGGVVTAETDNIPLNASPRARNAALTSSAGQTATVMKRKGLRAMNATPLSSSPAILGQYDFRRRGTGNFHVLVSNAGRFDTLNADGTTSAADALAASPFTSGDYYPDFTVANNLLFICNSQDAKKFDGTNVQAWGITKPTVGTMAIVDAGDAGSHNGTYEARVTFYNATTGHESSASASTATAVVTNSSINWSNIPVSADAQVTARRLYLRNTSTQAYFYLAGTVADNTATTATTNVLDTALIIRAPSTTENDPPPTGIRYAATHLGRVFVADQQRVYYSKIDLPEAFETAVNYLPFNKDDGQLVTGLLPFNGALLLFKEHSVYALLGDAPDNWVVELVDPGIGCASHRSITVVESVVRWWSEQGPAQLTNNTKPALIGTPLIGPTLSSENIANSQLGLVVSAVDANRERVLFAIPSLNQTRNDFYLPFNYRLGVWESDRWEAIDACSLATVRDSSDNPWVYAGGYKGQVFRWWDATNDGVASGTMTGTVSSATASTLTCSTATFDTTGGKLVERYVLAIDPAQTTLQRRRITGNTGTVLTVSPDWSDPPTSAWTFIVGGPQFEFDTRWMSGASPFHRKRYRFLYVLAGSTAADVALSVDVFFNFETLASRVKTVTLTASSETGEWDEGEWDVAKFSNQTAVHTRSRMARKARSWRARVKNYLPNQDVILYKIGMSGELLTDQNAT